MLLFDLNLLILSVYSTELNKDSDNAMKLSIYCSRNTGAKALQSFQGG